MLTFELNTELANKYCKEDNLNCGEMSISQLLMYLIYVKHFSRSKMIKIMQVVSQKIRDENNDEKFNDMRKEVISVKNLVTSLPFEKLGIKDNLFPILTDKDIDEVYSLCQPDQDTIHKISAHICKIEQIVHEWDENAKVVVFGSCSNGFMIKDCSDIDLTILLRNKLYNHPTKFNKQLRESLKMETNEDWDEIKTKYLYLLSSKMKDNTKIEILFNNISGLINTEYIRTFAEFDFRFHKLGYYLKYFIKNSKIFDEMVKLNSFTIICMLIVYLQDIVKPPVLPRIIEEISNSIPLFAPTYVTKLHRYEMDGNEPDNALINTIKSDMNCTANISKARKRLCENPDLINTSSCSELFRGFIHYYFNGGGFDHIHDVVDTRSGRVRKLSEIPSKTEDNVNGISYRIFLYKFLIINNNLSCSFEFSHQ